MDAAARSSLIAQAVVGLASFLTPFIYGALSVAMPTIGRDFDFSPHQMALVMMVHLLFSTSCNLPFGRLSDLAGRKRVFMAGSLVFTVSSLTAGLALTPWVLVAARALQGVGDAMTFGVGAAILVSVVPPERTGRALGLNVMFIYAGLALGPLAGGVFTSYVSWRAIFLLSAVGGATAFFLVWLGYREPAAKHSGFVDRRGVALYLPAMLAFILGVSRATTLTGIGLIALSAALFTVFVRVEARQEHPLADLAYLRANRPYAMASLTTTLGYVAGFSMSFLASLLLQSVMGLSARNAGLVLLVQPVILAAASPVAGRLSDRFHPAGVSAAGLAFLGVGLVLFGGLVLDSAWGVAGLLGLTGLGFGFFVSPNFNAVMRSADAPHRGMASGLLSTMQGLGMSVSLSVTGILLALFGGQAAHAGPEILPAIRACFILFGAAAMGAAWVAWRTPSSRGSGGQGG